MLEQKKALLCCAWHDSMSLILLKNIKFEKLISIPLGVRPYNVETPVPVRPTKLNNVEPGQYQDGSSAGNTRCCQLRGEGGVMNKCSVLDIGEPNSNSNY